jgi:hypothetical protein
MGLDTLSSDATCSGVSVRLSLTICSMSGFYNQYARSFVLMPRK